jgi:hypothetical protein
MDLDTAFAKSKLLNRVSALADRLNLGGGVGTSLNHLKRPEISRAGEGLELWVKHFLAGTIGHADEDAITKTWQEIFSFHGGVNNPPDVIIRDSLAVEVKKTQSVAGALQLNSSWPLRKLKCSDSHITQECREAELWTEKPFLLIVGRVNPVLRSITSLWIVDGRCLSDDESVYETLMAKARTAMLNLGGSTTREIGKFDDMDSLNRTILRVRPMFTLNHPAKIFEDIFCRQDGKQFILNILMLKSSYLEFSEFDRNEIESKEKGLLIQELVIKDPTDSLSTINAILISGQW